MTRQARARPGAAAAQPITIENLLLPHLRHYSTASYATGLVKGRLCGIYLGDVDKRPDSTERCEAAAGGAARTLWDYGHSATLSAVIEVVSPMIFSFFFFYQFEDQSARSPGHDTTKFFLTASASGRATPQRWPSRP